MHVYALFISQFLDEAYYDLKNYVARGECYLLRPMTVSLF